MTLAEDFTPDFYDPYSDVSLFLAREVKKAMREETEMKWSPTLQEKLLQKIAPEFSKHFPRYRLGVSSLKKTWEKISYYSKQMQGQTHLFNADGKLNVEALIRENIRRALQMKNSTQHQPLAFAHHVAHKITDFLAMMEGSRPMLDHLAQTIWAVQRHLLPFARIKASPSPYDTMDKLDKVVLKVMLEASAKENGLSQKNLSKRVHAWMQEAQSSDPSRLVMEELAYISIDHPMKSSRAVAEMASTFFQGVKKLLSATKLSDLEHKISLWTHQGDLVYRFLSLPGENGLLYEILHGKMRGTVKRYLSQYPHLEDHIALVKAREITLRKYVWYALKALPEESSLDRFAAWHAKGNLGEIAREQIPLIPLPAPVNQIEAEEHKRHA